MMKRIRAFTLIELMVVCGIIAILATLGVSNFSAAMKKGRDARQMSDVNNIRQALILYRADEGKYPGGLSGLTDKKYMSVLPKRKDGGDYYYNTDTKVFTICTERLEFTQGSTGSPGANSSSTSPSNPMSICNPSSDSSCRFYCLQQP
jgi:prepilin-type N-terminal cleavage/methylation domain-containing protein